MADHSLLLLLSPGTKRFCLIFQAHVVVSMCVSVSLLCVVIFYVSFLSMCVFVLMRVFG